MSVNSDPSLRKSVPKSTSKSTVDSYKMNYAKGTEPKMTPFFMRWSYGVNTNVPAINLTTTSKKVVFYACAHAGFIFDYKHNDMKTLQGHQNEITSIAADEHGNWIVTADSGVDNVVIVWDVLTGAPINTLFNIHGKHAPKVIGLSRNSKYLITIGDEKRPIIKFWLWSLGKQVPDAEFQCDKTVGEVKSCNWNSNLDEHFVITFENGVVFGFWDETEMKIYCPVYANTDNRAGLLTQSTYIKKCHNVFSGTVNGFIVIWGNTVYNCPFEECLPYNNDKEYIKAIKISNCSINAVVEENGILVTGDAKGRIRFFDNKINLLHFYEKFTFDPIIGISFNVERRCFLVKNTDGTNEVIMPDIDGICQEPDHIKRTVTEDVLKSKVLSDATLDRKPFVVQDFLVFTSTGRMDMVHFSQGIKEHLTHTKNGIITAITTHHSRNNLLVGNRFGELILYDMISHRIVSEITLFPDLLSGALKKGENDQLYITCLSYSPKGCHLACGFKSGTVRMLNCNTLEFINDEAFTNGKVPILKIRFSFDDLFMAYYDESNKVCLYRFQKDEMKWIFIGKVRSHYKPISDLLFSLENNENQVPNLYSLGEDRLLVKYDIENSIQIGKFIVKSAERVEQSAKPLCAIWSPMKTLLHQKLLLVADDQFKFKYYNAATGMTHGTMLTSTFGGTPIERMLLIPETLYSQSRNLEKHYLVFCNQKHIGIQILPPDGSPYRYTGMVGHPVEIVDMCMSADGKHLVTLGKNNTYILQWIINTRASDVMERIGGTGLGPFYSLIDGGRDGWLFHEMEDLFYYMQILSQGENTPHTRKVSNYIEVSQLPDIMRAIGFYPTEFEIENMLVEVKYKGYNVDREVVKEIEFMDFVKLYINHKPAFNVSTQELMNAFLHFASNLNLPETISRQQLIDILCQLGERYPIDAVKKFLTILLHYQAVENHNSVKTVEDIENFDFVPEKITFKILLEDLLGIDLKANFPNMFLEEASAPDEKDISSDDQTLIGEE